MNLKQVFNSEKQIAGIVWYKPFMRRNNTLVSEKPEEYQMKVQLQ